MTEGDLAALPSCTEALKQLPGLALFPSGGKAAGASPFIKRMNRRREKASTAMIDAGRRRRGRCYFVE
jgi:hypothetical protein